MGRSNWLIIVAIFSFFVSCSDKKIVESKIIKAKEEPLEDFIKSLNTLYNLEILEKRSAEGIKVTPLSIDSSVYKNGSLGISLTYEIHIDEKSINKLFNHKYDCYYYNISYGINNEDFPLDISDIKAAKFSNLNTDPLIAHSGKRKIIIHIPYRKLNAPKGLNRVVVLFRWYPTKFKKDPSMQHVKVLDQINGDPDAIQLYKFSLNTPEVKKLALKIDGFTLDSQKVNIKRYDFGVTGNGYPDLFWKLECGGEDIYASPIRKNTINYRESFQSLPFLTTNYDSIKITFADSDNELVLNKHDVIGRWVGSTSAALKKFSTPVDPQLIIIKKCKVELLKY